MTVLDTIDKRDLFLKELKKNNSIYRLELTDFFRFNVKYVFDIKANIINEIGFLLYIENKEKNKPW